MWLGGCGNCSGIGVRVVSLNLQFCVRACGLYGNTLQSLASFFFLTSQIGKLTTVANKTWALSSRNGTLCRRDRTGQNRGERQKREGGEAFCDWTVTRKGRREPLGRTRMEAIQLVRNRLCCRSYRCINTKCDFAPASAALSTVESKFTQKIYLKKTLLGPDMNLLGKLSSFSFHLEQANLSQAPKAD